MKGVMATEIIHETRSAVFKTVLRVALDVDRKQQQRVRRIKSKQRSILTAPPV